MGEEGAPSTAVRVPETSSPPGAVRQEGCIAWETSTARRESSAASASRLPPSEEPDRQYPDFLGIQTHSRPRLSRQQDLHPAPPCPLRPATSCTARSTSSSSRR